MRVHNIGAIVLFVSGVFLAPVDEVCLASWFLQLVWSSCRLLVTQRSRERRTDRTSSPSVELEGENVRAGTRNAMAATIWIWTQRKHHRHYENARDTVELVLDVDRLRATTLALHTLALIDAFRHVVTLSPSPWKFWGAPSMSSFDSVSALSCATRSPGSHPLLGHHFASASSLPVRLHHINADVAICIHSWCSS